MDKKPSNVIMFGCSSMNLNVEYNNNRQEKIIEQPTKTKDYEKELSENCTEKREVFRLTQTGPVVPVRTTSSLSFLYKHKISHNPWLNTMPLLSSYAK